MWYAEGLPYQLLISFWKGTPFPNASSGLFSRWMREINPMDLRNVPSSELGYRETVMGKKKEENLKCFNSRKAAVWKVGAGIVTFSLCESYNSLKYTKSQN